MKNGSLRRSLLLSAALLGCQGCSDSNQQVKTAPGALPSGQFSRADRTHEIHATTYFAHGHLLERQGAFDRAVEQYVEALKAKPDFVICENRLGITLNKLGRHAEASEHFRKAIALSSGLAHLHNNLGFSLYLEAKYEEAERSLARALELKPGFGRARMNHGITLAKLGKYNEAFSEMRTTTNAADAAFNMGMLLTEAGRYADAAKYLEAALAAKPNFEAARAQLNELSRLAAAEDAEAQAARAIDALRVEPATLIPETDDASTEAVVSEPTQMTIVEPESIAAIASNETAIEVETPGTVVDATDENSPVTETFTNPVTSDCDGEARIAVESATSSLWTGESPVRTDDADPVLPPQLMDDSYGSTLDAPTVSESIAPTPAMGTASDFDAWYGTESTGEISVVAGTSVESGATIVADDSVYFDDPNCVTGSSPLEPPARPVIRGEVVSSLIDDFAHAVKWHREFAAEVLCRLETYMQTGQLGHADDELSE